MVNVETFRTHKELSKEKRILFTVIIVLFATLITFIAAELILRYWRQYIEKCNVLDPGLVLYDKRLGWKLAANWKGQHKHYDFEVHYSTNRYGFRSGYEIEKEQRGSCYAFVGDSFTFCLGVNDSETFVQLLNLKEGRTKMFLNFGIPGYSTDQEWLLIQDRVFSFSPDVILLVVYLGNDLFDNELPFPLQADNAKPYFELMPDGLTLKNVPVPLKVKPKGQNRLDLMRVVLGDDLQSKSFIGRYLTKFELFRLLRLNLYRLPDLSNRFDDRFERSIRLFTAIVGRIRNACAAKEINFGLVLMPGRSFIERPGSPSAQFQDYLRKKIIESRESIKVRIIDLADLLRRRYEEDSGNWFYPNEGHLTPEGNRVVSDILAPRIVKLEVRSEKKEDRMEKD